MTTRTWTGSFHGWRAPGARLPRLHHLPNLKLAPRQAAALRNGLIVALCALLAGGLTAFLRDAARGPYAPTPAAATRGA